MIRAPTRIGNGDPSAASSTRHICIDANRANSTLSMAPATARNPRLASAARTSGPFPDHRVAAEGGRDRHESPPDRAAGEHPPGLGPREPAPAARRDGTVAGPAGLGTAAAGGSR